METGFLGRTNGKNGLDRIINEKYTEQLKVEVIEDTINTARIIWLGRVERMQDTGLVKKMNETKKKKDETKETWNEEVKSTTQMREWKLKRKKNARSKKVGRFWHQKNEIRTLRQNSKEVLKD